MKYAKHLLVIILIALVLRLAPVALQQMPISYDAPFHFRNAERIISSQNVPSIEESVELRPNSYPPLYHVLLAASALISGVKPIWLAMLFLPVIASLLPLSIFLALRGKNEKAAIVAAFFAAIFTPLVITSYDSPANIVFLCIPLALLLIEKGNKILGGLFFGLLLLWNYMICIISFLPFLIAMRKQRKALVFGILGFVISVLLLIIVSRSLPWAIHGLRVGMDFTAFNLRNSQAVSSALAIAFVGILLSWSILRSKDFEFWKALTAISFLALLASFFEVSFRGWEQIKFLGLGTVFLIASIPQGKNARRYCIVLGTIALIFTLIFSFQAQYSRISRPDIKAMEFASARLGQNEKLLAEPSMSEYFGYYTGRSQSVLASLYFENSTQDSPMPGALSYLMSQGGIGGNSYLRENNVKFILLNYEDATARGTALFASEPGIDKAYEVGYNENCPFLFIPASYSCGELEAKVLRFNKQ